MLKKFAYKKIIIISISFLVLLMIYFFPSNDNYNIHTTLTYKKAETIPIYLIDKNNYVARFEVIKKSQDTLELVNEVINNLTVDSDSNHIPNTFKKIIPKDTKILSADLKDNILKINFNKNILNINKEDEEKMLEAIIFSLTEIKDIKKIMIFVEGESLKEMPNSKKKLPLILDRSYGINKVYEIVSMKDISKVTAYYVSKSEDLSYYIPVTIFTNSKNEKIEVIVEKLKSSPTYQTNLTSYLKTSAELQNYEILENSVNLSFNNEILSLDDNKIVEEVKYSISLSVRDTYDIAETIFYVDNKLIDVNFLNI